MRPTFSGRFSADVKKREHERLFLIAVSGLALAIVLVTAVIFSFSPSRSAAAKNSDATVASRMPPSSGTGTIYSPSRPVAKGALLAEVTYNEDYLPLHLMPPGAIRDRNEFVNLYAASDIPANMPITRSMTTSERPYLSTLPVSRGHRALTIPVDQVSGVEGFIEPGTLVDVALTYHQSENGLITTKLIVQNTKIISYGGKVDQGMRFEIGNGAKQVFNTATLDLAPEEAIEILTARKLGTLTLLVRSSADRRILDKIEVDEEDIAKRPAIGGDMPQNKIEYCGQAKVDGLNILLPCSSKDRPVVREE